MSNYYLAIKWSTSRGRETYGWNICTASISRFYDPESAHIVDRGRWSTKGGGYDMLGTVVGHFLADRYQARLKSLHSRISSEWGPSGYETHDTPNRLYGLGFRRTDETYHCDGGCGIREMEKIAEAIGVRLIHTLDRKGNVTGYMVNDSVEAVAA